MIRLPSLPNTHSMLDTKEEHAFMNKKRNSVLSPTIKTGHLTLNE